MSSSSNHPQNDPATCYWLTGFSGAGKTTAGTLFKARLDQINRPALLLDGDVLRAVFGNAHGHDRADRLKLALSYSRLCREITAQGVTVICATISMFHSVHDWNRKNIPNYREIYLRVPIGELQERDPKGIYKEAKDGARADVVGLDQAAEEPLNPDMVIDNHGDTTAEETLDLIWNTLVT